MENDVKSNNFYQNFHNQRKLLSVYKKSSYLSENNVRKNLFNDKNLIDGEKSYSENYRKIITFENPENWSDFILPITILVALIGSILIIFYIWIKNYFAESSQIHQSEKILYSNIKSQKSFKEMSDKLVKKKSKIVESRTIKEDTPKIDIAEKKSPPTLDDDKNENDENQVTESQKPECNSSSNLDITAKNSRSSSPIIIAVPVPVPVPIPLFTTDASNSQISLTSHQRQQPNEPLKQQQQLKQSSTSSLNLLQEEVCCVQPPQAKETTTCTIGTSPPPFSPYYPYVHAQLSNKNKYTSRGTQTVFTKAPNSPNYISNTVTLIGTTVSTPTSASTSSENKENIVKTKKGVCVNKNVSNFKNDNMENFSYSPGNVSPKAILQEQNSPIIQSDSPTSSRFSFSPKIVSSRNSPTPTVSSSNYKHGNYFKFPEVDTLTPEPNRSKATLTPQTSFDYSNMNQLDEKLCEATELMRELSIDSDKDNTKENNIIILRIDEIEDNEKFFEKDYMDLSQSGGKNANSENTLTIRRQRLKSISLDSDGAKLVEENLGIPVEELLEELSQNNNKDIVDNPHHDEKKKDSCCTKNNNNNNNKLFRSNPKNIYNLTLNLDFRDNSLIDVDDRNDDVDDDDDDDDENNQELLDSDYENDDEFDKCKTPTMKYFRHKAVSLDSSSNTEQMKNANNQASICAKTTSDTFNYYFGSSNKTSSISVPSTPKHLTSTKLKISNSEEQQDLGEGRCNTLQVKIGNQVTKKFESFEKPTFMTTTSSTNINNNNNCSTLSASAYKTNLAASGPTLNVSTSNLKTLPEVTSITDFDKERKSSFPRTIPVKSGLLQRRGSNHSLTLNIDGSMGNLSRGLSCSNYSLGNLQGSHLSIAGSNYNLNNVSNNQNLSQHCRNIVNSTSAVKKNLLQRRGSNTSLTLNIQGSNNSLNRFNSHSSLNITGKKGLLERRNSNASLTLNIQNRGLSISNCNLRGSECSLSSVNTNQINDLIMAESEAEHEEKPHYNITGPHHQHHHRKFHSSENLHNLSIHSKYIHLNQSNRQHKQQNYGGSIDNLKHEESHHPMHNQSHDVKSIVQICTKPLSPQSTSEDFKIYLANIQYLQNASNVLNEQQLKKLNRLFQKSYCSQKVGEAVETRFNNDDVLNSQVSDGTLTLTDEEEKKLLINLHQEYWALPSNFQESVHVSGSQAKNRYKSILPNEHSRVILEREQGAIIEPYINANYIKGPDYANNFWIATQGPLPNTIYEFWLMIFQNIEKVGGNGLQKIAMLTDFVENGRQKCAKYFPVEMNEFLVFTNTNNNQNDVDFIKNVADLIYDNETPSLETEERINFNFFLIKNIGICQKNGYQIRKLKILYGNNLLNNVHSHNIYHYWFRNWPDHRSPQDIDVLLDMSLDILDGNCEQDFEGPHLNTEYVNIKSPLPVVHCSAGIGRTGCLTAILNGLCQMRLNLNNLNSDNNFNNQLSVDILGIVCNLRLQRGGMIQNCEQYELIHRVICLYQQRINSQI